MWHVNYTLRPLTIDNAKPREKAYALTDGGGLLIEVLPSGTKTWRYTYHLNGKREKIAIGLYPTFTNQAGVRSGRRAARADRARPEPGQSQAGSINGTEGR